ncbi:hypothetical protein BABINDRAFT_160647 [Babjeviella inositovora NRRL Y-12698]|uniref:Peptidase S54 rhomboid domain-containing protein n=1 Tax=Babjeviella inositovora NRRL Y-12698 TaxID=984486 RepID=A0A1E3QWA9_9ASCO|nr:uncharacterized protein BABINDRAFT_160647 [Babjeviella inositovora NRRL Y-12698]ODQ81277.1 hypothetical protein BABINDRAFT_160647 [Babjeviella inositovora NRRL Y-12698]
MYLSRLIPSRMGSRVLSARIVTPAFPRLFSSTSNTATKHFTNRQPLTNLFQSSKRWYATFRDNSSHGIRRARRVKEQSEGLRSNFSGGAGIPPFWRNPQNMKTLKRCGIFTVGFCCITHFATPYVYTYVPGFLYFKSHPQYVIYAIIGANLAVFGMWRLPLCYRILQRYFILEKDHIVARSALLGSAFSHQDFWHLAMNMMALYSFGPSLISWIGVSQFTVMYLNSCVISSFVAVLLPMMARSSLRVASLGASGAIFSVFGTFAYLFPTAGISLLFFPIPGGAWVAFMGSIAVNAAGFFMRWGAIDYAAHLGGSLAGIYYGYVCREQIKEKLERRNRRMGLF